MRKGWWSRLGGDSQLLEKLARVFSQGEPLVVTERGHFYVSVPGFASDTSELDVSNAAEQLVRRMVAVVNVFPAAEREVSGRERKKLIEEVSYFEVVSRRSRVWSSG